MIVELDEDEIKKACIQYVEQEYNLHTTNVPEDASISHKQKADATYRYIVRIECES